MGRTNRKLTPALVIAVYSNAKLRTRQARNGISQHSVAGCVDCTVSRWGPTHNSTPHFWVRYRRTWSPICSDRLYLVHRRAATKNSGRKVSAVPVGGHPSRIEKSCMPQAMALTKNTVDPARQACQARRRTRTGLSERTCSQRQCQTMHISCRVWPPRQECIS